METKDLTKKQAEMLCDNILGLWREQIELLKEGGIKNG